MRKRGIGIPLYALFFALCSFVSAQQPPKIPRIGFLSAQSESRSADRLPAIYVDNSWSAVGGLMSYGASITDQHRRMAKYVDKILKGAKAEELAIEQPTKFEFIINLKAAKQIGLTIPPNVLARADRVIR